MPSSDRIGRFFFPSLRAYSSSSCSDFAAGSSSARVSRMLDGTVSDASASSDDAPTAESIVSMSLELGPT